MQHDVDAVYRICSRNLRTLFSILGAEKSGCVKYADFFFVGGLNLGLILVQLRIRNVLLIFYCNIVT